MAELELLQKDIAFQANLYESGNPTRRWLHNVRREWVIRTLESVSPPNPHYFEVGIGCGAYTRWMEKRGHVFAVDINPDFVDAATGMTTNVVARVSDITQESHFAIHDVALCSEVLEHVDDSPRALKNIFASLKRGGYLVLTTPNAYSSVELMSRLLAFRPVVKLARLIYGEPVDDLGHINRMTRTQLRQQIEAAGFEIVSHENLAFYLPVIAELGGQTGARICQWFARKLAGTPLSWLLWTQCWVLRRPLR